MVRESKIKEMDERIKNLEKLVAYLMGGRINDKMRGQMGMSPSPY